MIANFLYLTLNFFFPSFCALCGENLVNAAEIKRGICCKCRKNLFAIEGKRCGVCGKPLVSEIDLCLSCKNSPEKPYDKLWVLYPYTAQYRELLAKYKFQKTLPLANFFAEELNAVILGNQELSEAEITPAPPRPGKAKEQGWDQVDYLVKKLKKLSPKRKVTRCLKRKKSKAQKSLNRKDRLENLKGRIFCKGNAPKTALIIDDVTTTGATMEACAGALRQAGAQKVYGICLFYD